eukprot:2152710-Rhodomonas_salina.3
MLPPPPLPSSPLLSPPLLSPYLSGTAKSRPSSSKSSKSHGLSNGHGTVAVTATSKEKEGQQEEEEGEEDNGGSGTGLESGSGDWEVISSASEATESLKELTGWAPIDTGCVVLPGERGAGGEGGAGQSRDVLCAYAAAYLHSYAAMLYLRIYAAMLCRMWLGIAAQPWYGDSNAGADLVYAATIIPVLIKAHDATVIPVLTQPYGATARGESLAQGCQCAYAGTPLTAYWHDQVAAQPYTLVVSRGPQPPASILKKKDPLLFVTWHPPDFNRPAGIISSIERRAC